MKTLCIYHGHCADGFMAAWAVRRFFGDRVEFYSGVYQSDPPNVQGRDVIFVDFCYKKPVMLELQKDAQTILVIDHHDTAMKDMVADPTLRIFNAPSADPKDVNWSRFLDETLFDADPGDIYTIFDMNRSGAGMTWDFFFPGEKRPRLVNHVEDRDLWRFALPNTREIQAAVFSYPYEFEIWDRLVEQCESLETFADLVNQGMAIERKHHKDVRELVEKLERKMTIGGYLVPVANIPYTMTSDAGHLMSLGYAFAACYWDTPQGRVFSLRSQDDGADVGQIAKLYGGGGHKHAAGFRVDFDKLAQFEPSL